MKTDIKLILIPLLALTIGAVALIYFNKKSLDPTPVKTETSILHREGNYKKGSSTAKVTVVEFFDPECEGCAAFHPLLKKIAGEYPNDVQIVARYMLFHGNSHPAALALEGAGKQGKFWEMYNFMLERQNEWSHQKDPVNLVFEKFAKELGLNIEEFNKAYDDITFQAALAKDMADGQALGVKGTPTFFINGKKLGNLSYNDLKGAIDEELKK
ncbi:MAG: DsbA family protein [Bacteriovorax sp.]|nr:DsbA family protein [Bacteriovorax sp.]